ncbi:hypothetical protein P8C59_006517 [Phyllachora maydis]|uniref:Uncharacterized protein n=1 Tax=Phyllachora maydis TaxID=1825666 RepID=A0AAD9I7M9_9PEZI|nr:hypothetical protein P8C59_006517 [Phyllachora maydis]
MPFSTNSLSNLDNSVYNILGIPTAPLAPAPIPAELAKIMPAVRCTAACKAKRRKAAKAYTTARKLAKKEGLRRSKRTTGSNAGRYTTDSGLTANKDDNNAYNRAYMPPANAEEEEEEEDGSSDDNSVNGGTSDSADEGKGSSTYKRSKGSLYYKDIPPYKQQRVMSYPYSPPAAVISRYKRFVLRK